MSDLDSTKKVLREPSSWEPSSGIDSSFRLVTVAAMRDKQLRAGSLARIKGDSRHWKNTSIALEEVKQGLVPFTIIPEKGKSEVAAAFSASTALD